MAQQTIIRLFATHDGLLDGHQFDRLIHVAEIGVGRLVEDVATFKAEAEKGDTAMATAAAMTSMAETFQGYVDEGTELVTKLRAARDASLSLSLCSLDRDSVEADMEGVMETVEEERQYRG